MIRYSDLVIVDSHNNQSKLKPSSGIDIYLPIICVGEYRHYVVMDKTKFVGYTDEDVLQIVQYAITHSDEPSKFKVDGIWFRPDKLMCYKNTKTDTIKIDCFRGIWEKQFGTWVLHEWDSRENRFDRGLIQYWRYPLSPLARRHGGGVDESYCLSPHRTMGYYHFTCHVWSMIYDNRNWVDGKYGFPPDKNANVYWTEKRKTGCYVFGRGDSKPKNYFVDHVTGNTAALPVPSDMFALRLVNRDVNDNNKHIKDGRYGQFDYDALDWGHWKPWTYQHIDQRVCGLPAWCDERAAISYSWYVEMIDRYNEAVRNKMIDPLWRKDITTHHPDGTPFKPAGDEPLRYR